MVIRVIAILTLAFISFSGCKEALPEDPVKTESTFSLSFVSDDNATTWSTDDRVILYHKGDYFTALIGGIRDESISEVRVNIPAKEVSESNPVWGFYPLRPLTEKGDNMELDLPDEFIVKDCIDPKNVSSFAAYSSSSSNLNFVRLNGLICLRVSRKDINKIVISSHHALAGKVQITVENGMPFVKEIIDTCSFITLAANDGEFLKPDCPYYLPILPIATSASLRMDIYSSNSAASAFVQVTRLDNGKMDKLGTIDLNLNFYSPDDIIVFDDPVAKTACVSRYDLNKDGELSYAEAAMVTSISGLFEGKAGLKSFDELMYFTSLSSLDNALTECQQLKRLSLPSSLEELCPMEFYGCLSLESLSIPNGVTRIGEYAFGMCRNLRSIVLPPYLSKIGAGAFHNCDSLVSVEMPQTLKQLEERLFAMCHALEHIKLPEEITEIPCYCFDNCQSLKEIDIPESVTAIGHHAFYACFSINEIELPSALLSIEKSAFEVCYNLKRLVIPNGVVLGESSMAGCTSLSSVTLPEDLTTIPPSCFDSCFSLSDIVIPESVTKIGSYAFKYCRLYNPNLDESVVTIPFAVSHIGREAFTDVEHIKLLPNQVVNIESNSFNETNALLYVPIRLFTSYQADSNWQRYQNQLHTLKEYPATKQYPEPKEVDLQLPSGIIWASCNLGASKPEEQGYYFSWGAPHPSGSFYDFSYPFYDIGTKHFTKYIREGHYGEDITLEPEDDAVITNVGRNWRMPTRQDFSELIDPKNCSLTWATINGVKCCEIRSLKNGNSIFLPAAGWYLNSVGNGGPGLYNSFGGYWTSSLGTYSSSCATQFTMYESNYPQFQICDDYRTCGLTIRPVKQ